MLESSSAKPLLFFLKKKKNMYNYRCNLVRLPYSADCVVQFYYPPVTLILIISTMIIRINYSSLTTASYSFGTDSFKWNSISLTPVGILIYFPIYVIILLYIFFI